jgi:hypothetical protein
MHVFVGGVPNILYYVDQPIDIQGFVLYDVPAKFF